jgi:hypothetical protein
MVKISSLPAATVFLAGGDLADISPVSGTGALPSAIAPPYLLTRAFLI